MPLKKNEESEERSERATDRVARSKKLKRPNLAISSFKKGQIWP